MTIEKSVDETETEGGCDMHSFQTTQLAIPTWKMGPIVLNLSTLCASHLHFFVEKNGQKTN